MSDFSLGAAIGATGRFPKLKINKVEDEVGAQADRELANIRSRISVDKKAYHPVYVEANRKATENLINNIAQAEKYRDPERVTIAYQGENDLNAIQNNYLTQSRDLFDLEDRVKQGSLGKSPDYIPPSLKMLNDVVSTSRSEEMLLKRLSENPQIFVDGYMPKLERDENGLLRIKPIFHERFDWEKIASSNDFLSLAKNGTLMEENINTNDKEKTIKRFYSIPANRDEAIQLKNKFPEIDPSKNAYDIGKNWFTSNPLAEMQYRSELYWDGIPDAQDPMKMSQTDLYNSFYNKYVITNIPVKYENKDQIFRRTNINVYNSMGDKVAPTNFQVGPMTLNYKNGANSLKTQYASSVSKDPAGTQVQVPQNRYIISMNTGLPDYKGTAGKEFYINRIAILPCYKTKDPQSPADKPIYILVPATDEEIEKYPNSIMHMPFAIGDTQPIKVSEAPDVGKFGYAIPLYEPNKDGVWEIAKDKRSKRMTGGSPLLSQVIERNNWNTESKQNWDKTFFDMMKQVVDEPQLAEINRKKTQK